MMPWSAAALGLTGMIGPSKPPFMRFVISAAPTDLGRAMRQ